MSRIDLCRASNASAKMPNRRLKFYKRSQFFIGTHVFAQPKV